MKINEAIFAPPSDAEELQSISCLIADAEESLRMFRNERVKLASAHLKQALRCIRREREERESNASDA